ncbi:response regulator [Brunnivagina elsteri]|uniref:histidine kinase n=1 Tax=Brunnivagina elsteri CCALA 953 TaxID=987040 RepID=A0A2A2TGH1_9CYAN|nr:response regulator [Calothrix elsteri]PAX52728.1 transcriptional regulator [Calothrix elsteri CCALA 953]
MKILIVEDDELVAEAVASVLTNQNYVVEFARDGQSAWELIENFEYDLLLLDVMLPKLDGISLCRQIRNRNFSMPILLLTGKDSSHDKAIGLDAGADDYLVKPFDQEELLARVRALLRRGSLAVQPILEWGKLRLDPTSCQVHYGTQLLSLTPKEYGLLELFLRNSRRVFSCGMILEHLWSYEDIPGEEAVRTHIKGLRQKLKAAGASGSLIETVYGIGYRLKLQEQDCQEIVGSSANSISESESKSQQTLSVINQIWQKFKGRVINQVSVLEQISVVLSQKDLGLDLGLDLKLDLELEVNSDLYLQAKREAHTLAGSLGTFGFGEGSKIARKIENILKKEKNLDKNDIRKLSTLVKNLQQEIEPSLQENQDIPNTSSDDRTLLLVVTQDSTFAEQLIQESAIWDLKVIIATSIATARNKLYQEHPSIVLLDPSISADEEDSLKLLAEFRDRKPPVPVLVVTEQNNLSSRLQIARSGGNTFLQKPIAPAKALSAVTQVLQQSDPTQVKVLAVDDDPQILALLQNLLTPWGLTVKTLAEPEKFWETLESVQPDILILDVEMPGFNGIELCQVVRKDSQWSELPILFLTVHNDADIINQVFSVGADDFVSKPFVGPELVTRIINRWERMKLVRRMAQTQQVKQNTESNQEHQRIQAALENSQARLAGIVEIADDGIISIDSNQRITLFNRGAEKIFGFAASEVLGRPLNLLIPLRFTQAHRQHVDEFSTSQIQTRRMGERREIYGKRKDGTEFPAEASISKLNLGEEIIYTVYLQDISERKEIECMKDEFISVVSHELRTPLTSIHGSLGMLTSGLIKAESEQGKRLLQIATDSSDRLVRLINDILDIERIESGKVRMEKQSCNVADLLTEAIKIMQSLADRAGIILSVDSSSGQIWADSDRIVQTLTNLISNAIKFSKPGDTVVLEAQPQGEEVIFSVKDTGRGIPEDKLETIFERFQQVDASDSRRQDGTGLGLAICKSIIQQHNGRIWVESTLNQGSKFYFALSLFKSVEISELKSPSTQKHTSVLVCEDNPTIRTQLKAILEQQGYRVITINSGEDGNTLRSNFDNAMSTTVYANNQNPEVVLLDLLVPNLKGWEVTAILKKPSDKSNIPMILCSVGTTEARNQSTNPFVDWVCQPVEENSLFQLLQQLLTQSSKPSRVLIVEDDPKIAELLVTLLNGNEIEK